MTGFAEAGDATSRGSQERQRGAKARMLAGFVAKGLDFLVRIGQQLLLVPLFIRAWGVDAYGAWLVLFGAAGMLGLVEFGMRPYLGNLLQERRLSGDEAGFWRAQHMFVGLYLGLSALVLAILGAAGWLFDVARLLGAGGMAHANAVLFALFVAFVFQMMRTPFFVVYRGMGYFVRGSFGEVFFFLATTIVLAGCLALKLSPLTTALAYAGGSAVFGLLPMWADQIRWLKRLPYGLRIPDREMVAGIGRSGPMFLLGQLPQRVRPFLPVLLLGAMGQAAAAISQFAVLRVLTMMLRRLILSVASVPGVEMGEAYMSGEHDRFRRIHAHSVRLLAGATGLCAGLILALGPDFVAIWGLGKVPYDGVLMAVLTAAVVVAAPSEATIAGLRFANLPNETAVAGGAQVLLCVLLSFLLVPIWGSIGVAAAFGVAEVLTQCVYLFWVAERRLKLGLPLLLLRSYLLALGLGGGSGLVALGVLRGLGSPSLLGLAIAALAWAAVSAPVAYFLLLTPSQRQWGVKALRKFSRGANRKSGGPDGLR